MTPTLAHMLLAATATADNPETTVTQPVLPTAGRVRGVHVTRPSERQAADPDRPIRLDLFGTAFVDLTPREAERVAANLVRCAWATRPDADDEVPA